METFIIPGTLLEINIEESEARSIMNQIQEGNIQYGLFDNALT